MGKAISGSVAAVVSLVVVASACSKPTSSTEKGAATTAGTVPPGATKPTPPRPGTAAPTSTPASPPPGASPAGRAPDGLPADIPATRSKVPTVAEWAAVGEITVARSTPLGCETKMVREWLRVSCRGKSHTGGKPENVTKLEGCGAETLLYSKTDTTTSVVTPVLQGKSCEVRFTWTNDKAAWLSVDWAATAPRPVIAFRE